MQAVEELISTILGGLEQLWLLLGLDQLVTTLRQGETGQLLSVEGVAAIAAPLIPCLLLVEMLAMVLRGQFHWRYFRLPLLMLIVNGVIMSVLSLSVALAIASLLRPYALLETSFTWYWFIYGYIVWEFSHFVYHYLGHRVRLLWCLHSTHHAPRHMNLSVSFAHFFLEAPYADLVRIGICTLAGLDPAVLLLVIAIDSLWGSFIHVGEEMMPNGRMGFLQKVILTPSHHRLHHARNNVYIDTNFCNLLNIWDRLFGTYKEQEENIAPDYGIKRPMNPDSFFDVYFGEFVQLFRDMRSAPRWADKLRYLLLPPDWRHDAQLVTVEEK
jgi:sterol desaturase/sphingolipid hydroxylase (fatty acid hydroxylase superfamily)